MRVNDMRLGRFAARPCFAAKRRFAGPRRRGAAMVEFVACIPLLGVVLALTFFFGWAMNNQQHVWIADRYAAWRSVRGGAMATEGELNAAFFRNIARDVHVSGDGGPSGTRRDFADAVASVNQPAGDLAAATVADHYPNGRRVWVSADFPPNVGAARHFSGVISHRFSRAGVEWRWPQVRCEVEVTDQFLPALDNLLAGMPAPADHLARMFRSLYRNGWWQVE